VTLVTVVELTFLLTRVSQRSIAAVAEFAVSLIVL